MGRDSEFKNKIMVGVNLEKEERDELQKIANRDHDGNISKLSRQAIIDYIKAHGEGNATFSLDTWQQDPGFQAVPTLFADNEKWSKYFKDSNKEDRNKVRVSINRLNNIFNNVEFNEGKKKSPIEEYLARKK